MTPQAGQLLLKEVAPRLDHTIRHGVPAVGCENAQELTQDALALATRLLHQAEVNGKVVTAGNVAYYAFNTPSSGAAPSVTPTPTCRAAPPSSTAALSCANQLA